MRKGDWIQTYTGGRFYPLDPREDEVRIEDIAHALANQCRFSGHTRVYYSVAEHCLRVSGLLMGQAALYGLLHDAAEAYLHDLPTPLKQLPDFAFYREAEAQVQRCIYRRFGLCPVQPHAVKRADEIMLVREAHSLMAPLDVGWGMWLDHIDDGPSPILCMWGPERAEREYLARFLELTK
jgi:hypothetical protein